MAAGDREGNLRVYNVNGARPKLLAFRPAHDAEVLTLDYSPGTLFIFIVQRILKPKWECVWRVGEACAV